MTIAFAKRSYVITLPAATATTVADQSDRKESAMKRAVWGGIGAALALLASVPATAEPAHEHGVAQLNVALDGSELVLFLESPAYNLVGFEHHPRDAAEREQLAQALTTLDGADRLFLPDAAAQCRLDRVAVEGEKLLAADDPQRDGDKHHDDDEHDNDEHEGEHHKGGPHEGEHHADEGHDDGDEHHAGDEHHHTDLAVTARFQCAQPEQLHAVTVELFSAFPHLERIRYQAITDNGQGGGELSAAAPRLTLP